MSRILFVCAVLLLVWLIRPLYLAIVVLSTLLWYVRGRSNEKIEEKPVGKALQPVQYEMKDLVLAKLTGQKLLWASRLVDTAIGRAVVVPLALRQSNSAVLTRYKLVDHPTYYPIVLNQSKEGSYRVKDSETIPEGGTGQGFNFASIEDFAKAFRSGKTTPSAIAEKIISSIKTNNASDRPLRAFVQIDEDEIKRMAEASTRRFRDGVPLSIFDGVPVGFKEEYSVIPYHFRAGTSFLGETPVTSDATIVKKIRELGAMIIGMTNMHELGMGTTGSNPNKLHGTPRNPYNLGCYTGGSSSGSAAAVGAGLVPLAMANDGGGSVRTPASLCGVVGLKATFGRISDNGCFHLCSTVAHAGPIASCVRDAAIIYDAIAGPDPECPVGLQQPPVELCSSIGPSEDLSGLRIGVYWQHFKDAHVDVVDCCNNAVEKLSRMGAVIVSIEIPEMEEARMGHFASILSEMASFFSKDKKEKGHLLNPETRLTMTMAGGFTAEEYFKAQQQRTRTIGFLKDIFRDVDCIITPTNGITAPEIMTDAESHGESDATLTGRLCRFAALGNYAGVPAISVPVGYDSRGLPIGLQIMGKWWEEKLLFHVAYAVESKVSKRQPAVHYSLLS